MGFRPIFQYSGEASSIAQPFIAAQHHKACSWRIVATFDQPANH
jgi:hypothetical protein